MANPQLEDGHTRIANELLDAIPYMRLTAYETSIFIVIIRKTYGYQKKMDKITNSQIVERTGIYKGHVTRTINKLVNRRMVVKIGKLMGVQKDYELWLPKLPSKVTIDTKVTSRGNYNEHDNLPNQASELPNEVTGVIAKLPNEVTGVIAKLPNEVTGVIAKLPNEVTKVTSPLVTQKKKETINKETINKRNKYINQRYDHLVKR